MSNHEGDVHDRAYGVAGAVVERRRALGLRQEDLADLAQVSHRFVQALEAGKPTVRLDKVVAVLEALGLELAVVPRTRGRQR
jgi:HTH-type transcriptional regulator / antitoxin HipB